MRRKLLWALAAGLMLSSAALGWAAWDRGELELYLFLVFPVLKAGGAFALASVLLGFAALLVLLLSIWTGDPTEGQRPEGRASVGGVVLIGPVPIVLGSDRRTAFLALVVAAAAMTVMILFLIQ